MADQRMQLKLLALQDAIDRDLEYYKSLFLLMSDESRAEAFQIFLLEIRARLEGLSKKVAILRRENGPVQNDGGSNP
ncbi:MAG: hypothetical protein AB1847_16750 [bacterium]